jgi:lysophospholipase L1-like esterase
MRHGELDGYRAKLVVLQTLEPNPVMSPAESAASYAPLIAEIRARQPQAKILVFNIPRAGQQVAEVNARAGAGIVEDGTVFYAGLGEQLVPGRSGYEAWAAALEPWLKRFAG